MYRENATVKGTVLPKVVKQNDVSHYFWKKLSKLDVSKNTRKKWRMSIKDLKILGKNDTSQLKISKY